MAKEKVGEAKQKDGENRCGQRESGCYEKSSLAMARVVDMPNMYIYHNTFAFTQDEMLCMIYFFYNITLHLKIYRELYTPS